jgi:hypothetical protein
MTASFHSQMSDMSQELGLGQSIFDSVTFGQLQMMGGGNPQMMPSGAFHPSNGHSTLPPDTLQQQYQQHQQQQQQQQQEQQQQNEQQQ